MKAHKFKSARISRETLQKRFEGELQGRIRLRVQKETGDDEVYNMMRLHAEEYKLYCIQEKKKLLQDWENSGRNISFCDESIIDLIYREYAHRSAHQLFGSREEERKYTKLVEAYQNLKNESPTNLP